MLTRELLLKYKVTVDDESSIAEAVYEKILKNYMEELDEVVEGIEKIVKDIEKGNLERYSNEDLERVALKIPTLMYKIGGDLERMGLRIDVAEALKDYKFNEIITDGTGTVADKKAQAENQTLYDKIIEDIYKRVYKQIDRRLRYIDDLYNSVKKVMTLRIKELEVFRRESANNNYITGEGYEQV